MNRYVVFFLGSLLGGVVGFFIAAFMSISKEADSASQSDIKKLDLK